MPPQTQQREQVQIRLGSQSYIIDAPVGLSNDEIVRRAVRADPEFASNAKLHPATATIAAQEQGRSQAGRTITQGPESQGQDLMARIAGQDKAAPMYNAKGQLDDTAARQNLSETMKRYGGAEAGLYSSAFAPSPVKASAGIVGAAGGSLAGKYGGQGLGYAIGGKAGEQLGERIGALVGGAAGGYGSYRGVGAAEDAALAEKMAQESKAVPISQGPHADEYAAARAANRKTLASRMAPAEPGSAPGATQPGVKGSVAKPSGRLVLTPQEAQSEAQMQQIAESRASRHGMQYAGGMRPAGGGRVPMTPTGTSTQEYPPQSEFSSLRERMAQSGAPAAPVAFGRQGEGTSAVGLVSGEAPPTNPSQQAASADFEIRRNQAILAHPAATDEEKASAANMIQVLRQTGGATGQW